MLFCMSIADCNADGLHCMQALENAKANDLLFWASRYNLFVLWSADRTHPWDSLPGAASYVTLEIGKQRGSDSEVRPLHSDFDRDAEVELQC